MCAPVLNAFKIVDSSKRYSLMLLVSYESFRSKH